jgi:hypothetical protein
MAVSRGSGHRISIDRAEPRGVELRDVVKPSGVKPRDVNRYNKSDLQRNICHTLLEGFPLMKGIFALLTLINLIKREF